MSDDHGATGRVMTVTGPRDATSLGMVLPHEHIFCNTLREYRSDGLLDDERLIVRDLARFVGAGGGAIVELTTSSLGRNPEALHRVSVASGVPIVMGVGSYRDPYIDVDQFDRLGVDGIAEQMIQEIEQGVGERAIRPGIIGEVGCNSAWISSAEERGLRAAARAQRKTGLSISLHAARWTVGRDMLQILRHEGVDPTRVVVGHLDTVADTDYHRELAAIGCFLEFDGFSSANRYEVEKGVSAVMALVRLGYLDQLLVSHDLFRSSHFPEYGGVGFSFLGGAVREEFARQGLSDAEFAQLTVQNPQRALLGR